LIFGLALNVGEGLDEIRRIASLTVGSRIGRVWVSYSVRGRDPFDAASVVAAANLGLRVGIGALSPYIYCVDEIKSRLLGLVERFGERFDLCLGLGDKRVLEDLGHKVSHSAFLSLLTHALKSLRGDLSRRGVRIWLGAQGSKTLALSEYFDGVLLNHCSVDAVRWALERMGSARWCREVGVSAPSYIYEDFEVDMFAYVRRAALKILAGASRALARDLNLEAEYKQALTYFKNLMQEEGCEEKIVSEDLVKSLTITMHASALPNYLNSMRGLGVTEVVFGYPISISTAHIEILKSTLARYVTEGIFSLDPKVPNKIYYSPSTAVKCKGLDSSSQRPQDHM